MIGYNPPQENTALTKLPHTRITTAVRSVDLDDGFNLLTIEFQGTEEELDQTDTVVDAAMQWLRQENLTGFKLKYPLHNTQQLSKRTPSTFIRKLIFKSVN